jgi:hypothetical protein
MVAEEHVQEVRSEMKAGEGKGKMAKGAKKAARKAAKIGPKPKAQPKGKKTAAELPSDAKKGVPSKAAFVRSQSPTMPAKQVVAAGAALGLSLSPDYIHKVRSTAKAMAPGNRASHKKVAPRSASGKKATGKQGVAGKAAPRAKAIRNAPKLNSDTSEAGFRRLVIDLGVVRAKSLIAEVERKVDVLIAGR